MQNTPNPLLKLKEQMNYTYDDLAEQFDVSRSVIQRIIEGAYPHISPRVAETLAYIQGVSREQIDKEYDEFVCGELHRVSLPAHDIDRNTSLDDFDVWAGILLRMNSIKWVDRVPHLSVARLLKLNVSVISRFYTGETAHIPLGIIDRVNTIKEMHVNDSL